MSTEEYEESASSPAKPSKVPSWITLGFILGAACVWPLSRVKETPPPPPAAPVEIKPAPGPTHARYTDVEANFAQWRRYALWADDVTYICMWDVPSASFRDCFEVLNRGDALYFRSIDRPRNLRTREDVPPDSPLQFFNPTPEPPPPRWERTTIPLNAPMDRPTTAPLPTQPEKIPIEINPPKP